MKKTAAVSSSPDVVRLRDLLTIPVIVASLGYFVDIYDLILFSIVRISSLRSIGLQGQDLLNQGVSGMQQVIANLSAQTAELNQVKQEHQNAINLAQQSLGTAENVDPATVITQLNTLETNMQASYTSISELQRLSLVNYLSTPIG